MKCSSYEELPEELKLFLFSPYLLDMAVFGT